MLDSIALWDRCNKQFDNIDATCLAMHQAPSPKSLGDTPNSIQVCRRSGSWMSERSNSQAPEYPGSQISEHPVGGYPGSRVLGYPSIRAPGCSGTQLPGHPDDRASGIPNTRTPGRTSWAHRQDVCGRCRALRIHAGNDYFHAYLLRWILVPDMCPGNAPG